MMCSVCDTKISVSTLACIATKIGGQGNFCLVGSLGKLYFFNSKEVISQSEEGGQ